MNQYRLRIMSVDLFDLFDTGLNASDDGRVINIGQSGHFMAMGGTNNSNVNNRIHTTTDFGKTWTRETDGTFPALNANGISYRSDEGKVKIWGGNAAATINSSYEWTKVGGTVQIAANMTGYRTSGLNRASAAHFDDGTYYYAVGGIGCTDVIRSSDLITWTQQMILPADCQDSGGASCFKYNGEWYYMTGQQNGTAIYPAKIYKINAAVTTFTEVIQNDLFSSKWGDIVGNDNVVFYVRGHKDGTGNRKGCYYNDGDLANINDWKRLPYEIPATHANPLAIDNETDKAISYCGNMRNDSWLFERIDL